MVLRGRLRGRVSRRQVYEAPNAVKRPGLLRFRICKASLCRKRQGLFLFLWFLVFEAYASLVFIVVRMLEKYRILHITEAY